MSTSNEMHWRRRAAFQVLVGAFALAVCATIGGCGAIGDCNEAFPMSADPLEVTRGVEVPVELTFDREFLDPERTPASQTAGITLISKKVGTQSMLRFDSWAPELTPELKDMEIVDGKTVRFKITVPEDFDTGDANLHFTSGAPSTCEGRGGMTVITIR